MLLTLFLCLFDPAARGQGRKPAGRRPAARASAGAPLLKQSLAAGASVYKQYCLSCHQPDGGGMPNLNSSLSQTSWVLGDKPRLISVVLNGLQGQVIDGVKYENVMPGHSFLTDKQVADVLTYVRNNFDNKASLVTAAEVKGVRSKKQETLIAYGGNPRRPGSHTRSASR